MTRTNWILAGILLVQAGLAAWLLRPAEGRSAAQPLVAKLASADVSGVRISDAVGSVQLAKGEQGWSAPEAGGYPVHAAGVTKLISDVLAIDSGRLVANTPSSHARLKVDPNNFARRIELQRVNDDPLVIYLGSSPNANATHVRLEGQDAVYLATGELASEARSDLAGWIDTRYISADPQEVAQIEILNAGGRFTLARAADATWQLDDQGKGERVNQDKAVALVSGLAGLQMVRPLGRESKSQYGLGTPQASFTLTVSSTQDVSQTITLDVGALDDAAGSYTVKSSASEYYASVAKAALQEVLEQTRAGLLAGEAAQSQ
jgi:hypothetical protein